MYELTLTHLRKEDTCAFVLLSIAIKQFGVECFQWEPELLRKELEEDNNVKLKDLLSDKLQAAIIVLTTNSFEKQWEVFEKCTHLFNNTPDDFSVLSPLEAEEIASALAEVHAIRDREEDQFEFSDEVNVYAGLVFYEYGLSKAPDIFPSAIIPHYAVECNDDNKNEALNNIYHARFTFLREMVERIKNL